MRTPRSELVPDGVGVCEGRLGHREKLSVAVEQVFEIGANLFERSRVDN